MKYLSIIDFIVDNWGAIMGYSVALVVGFDKLVLVAIKTLANIRDAWRESFPKKQKELPDLLIEQ
jgi:hypothetical protein